MCDSCNHNEKQVNILGPSLKELSADEVMGILNRRSQIKPIHVKKNDKNEESFYLHFLTENDAGNFLKNYKDRRNHLCCELKKYSVRAALARNTKEAVTYNITSRIPYINCCVCRNSPTILSYFPIASPPATEPPSSSLPTSIFSDNDYKIFEKVVREKKEKIGRLRKKLEEEEALLELAERTLNMKINKQ